MNLPVRHVSLYFAKISLKLLFFMYLCAVCIFMMIIFCYNEIVTDISSYSSGRHVGLSPFSQHEIELERRMVRLCYVQ